MNFPRETVRINGCLAMVGKNGPWLHRRPTLNHEGKRWYGARLAYHLNKEEIGHRCRGPADNILHTCDVFWCIDPDHLYLGTIKQNVADLWARKPPNRKGEKRSDETRRKLAEKGRLRRHSEETKRKISEGSLRMWKRRARS